MQRNKIIQRAVLGAALSILAVPVLAQPPVGYDPALPLWAGPYAGFHGGGSWSDFSRSTTAGPNGGSSSATGGAQIGYNWQRDRLVFGAEGDWSWLGQSSHNNGSFFSEDWQSTIRGRVGYAMGEWLPYATGGLALTQTHSRINGVGNRDDLHAGLAAGGGVEKYISPRWSARAEYLYTDVPEETASVSGVPFSAGAANNAVRAGLNYHFF